nr:hypothetical protein [Enterococcus faecium]
MANQNKVQISKQKHRKVIKSYEDCYMKSVAIIIKKIHQVTIIRKIRWYN